MRQQVRREPARISYVTIVADNPETLDGLQEYFQRAGIGAHGTRQIRKAEMIAPASGAVVFFPDDFSFEDVKHALAQLERLRPDVLAILVTSDPKRIAALQAGSDERVNPAVVIPKPAWGWTILDAIRSHLG